MVGKIGHVTNLFSSFHGENAIREKEYSHSVVYFVWLAYLKYPWRLQESLEKKKKCSERRRIMAI